ncbi:DUF7133 domain-containing protein [Pollutibacter soli]|uniref:DUF7133 domain-containing protein n=1 Tax=Pollutibacter soli TaxID=3034157 RepID=UPI0030141CBF
MLIRLLIPAAYVCIIFLFPHCSGAPERKLDETAPAYSPEESQQLFRLEPRLKIELVASEPMIEDPVVAHFDGEGRLWVVEMRGFMPDINGKGEKNPVGRISILTDTNADGKMDYAVVWLDSLVLPRAIAIVPQGALIAEERKLWLTKDLDGDLRADEKIVLDSVYADGPSPEHSANGLMWNIDNWYYNARSKIRYRLRDGKWERDSTEFRGQWGITHDDFGHLMYNYNWSQLHGDLVPPNELSANKNHSPTTGIDHGLTLDRRVYPIRSNPAVNRGYVSGTLDKNGRLLEFTAASAPYCYRSHSMGEEYYGNVFVCEPAGNLVKRNVISTDGVILSAVDPKPGTEFLASTDERFRPVYITGGPDGALYVVDMYRGQVQHGSYVTPYLRDQTLKRKLDQPIHKGRIWRIVSKDRKTQRTIKFSELDDQVLISLLSNDDGWVRDQAQKKLVERNNKNNADALYQVLRTGGQLARFHALWTLEGLQLLSSDTLVKLLKEQDPYISSAALRLLEPVIKNDPSLRKEVSKKIIEIANTSKPLMALQMALSAESIERQEAIQLEEIIAKTYDSSALFRDALMSSLQGWEMDVLHQLWRSVKTEHPGTGRVIFFEMLSAAILQTRNPDQLNRLFNLMAEQNSTNWKVAAVISAVSVQGRNTGMRPVKLDQEPALMKSALVKKDSSFRQAMLRLFEWPGHRVDTGNAKVRNQLSPADQQSFITGRQLYLSSCVACHGMDGNGMNRLGPPLRGSDWVLGDQRRLVMILLHGIEGPIMVNEKKYDVPAILPVMPAHSILDDEAIASVITYIRNEWGNNAGAMGRGMVSKTRHLSQGRVMPWTASELNTYIKQTDTSKIK